MLQLDWELSVLSRAVAYGNLSAAALHVGLSQPQLSRIIARIEERLGVVLLDRSVRRKSGWTPIAFKLAETYAGASRKLEGEIQKLVSATEPEHLHLATLEGLMPVALRFAHELLKRTPARVLELDVHDLHRLEEQFLAGEVDLVFTSREPGRRKLKHVRILGYQSIESSRSPVPTRVMSTFEFRTTPKEREVEKTFVSNSLEVRRSWLKEFGGQGSLPSALGREPGKGLQAALLLGQEQLGAKTWDLLSGLKI